MTGEGYKVTLAFFVMFTTLAIVAMFRPSELSQMIMVALVSALSGASGMWFVTRGKTTG
jgi:nicotinamide riboside transporter PnuC